jgi:hypothetical protein
LEQVILRTVKKNGGAITLEEVALEADTPIEKAKKSTGEAGLRRLCKYPRAKPERSSMYSRNSYETKAI